MKYEDLKEEMEVEIEGFHYSNWKLTWRKGIIRFIDFGLYVEKSVMFNDKEGLKVFPHRMEQVRLPVN